MISFSYKHRLHRLVLLEQGLHYLIIFHLVEYWISASFKVQLYLLSSVACLYFEFLKELVWFKYLVLKAFSVIPTQFFCLMLSSLITVAFQTTPSVWHFPESRQEFFWRQLLSLFADALSLVFLLSSLNSRNKLISTCRHRKKHLLCNQ